MLTSGFTYPVVHRYWLTDLLHSWRPSTFEVVALATDVYRCHAHESFVMCFPFVLYTDKASLVRYLSRQSNTASYDIDLITAIDIFSSKLVLHRSLASGTCSCAASALLSLSIAHRGLYSRIHKNSTQTFLGVLFS